MVGEEPQSLLDELLTSQPIPMPPNIVPIGLKSDILRRRPDIRLAESNLEAETADIGVATAQLFPSFSLTSSVVF